MSNQRERVKIIRPDGGYGWVTRKTAESVHVREIGIRMEEEALAEVPELANFSASDGIDSPSPKKRGRPTKAQ